MSFISRESIESIRHRVNIVDVVEPYVQLKQSGSSFKGLSPFNNEKTPSFTVHPDKGFYCFSSGQGGDMFKFIQLLENLNFHEAVEHIASRFGIELQYDQDTLSQETRSLRSQLLDIYQATAQFYHQEFLSEKKHGQFCQRYWLEERQFSLALAKTFQIGSAPPGGNPLLEHLTQKGFSEDALVQSKLFFGDNIRRLRPMFRGRLMVPILDIQGRVIAFTARKLEITPQDHDIEKGKYINSLETPIFHKKKMLFNLCNARKPAADKGRFLLVEGQLDALRCWEKGIQHAIAAQGSSITDEQLGLLKRYAGGLDCLLDSDAAGLKAALRIIPAALKANIDLRILTLPEGKDPDDLLRENGEQAFDALIPKAESAIQFAAKALVNNPLTASLRDKNDALKQIFSFINESQSAVGHDEMLKELSQALFLERASLEHDFKRYRTQSQNREPEKDELKSEFSAELLTSAEEELLLLILHTEDTAYRIANRIDPDWIDTSTIVGKLLDRFLASFREDLWPGTENIQELIENDEESNIVYAYLNRNLGSDSPERDANIALKSLFTKYCERQKRQLETQLLNAGSDPANCQQLQERIAQIRRLKLNPPAINI